jgi:Chaperone of endosialidase
MKALKKSSMVLISALVAIVGIAYAAQPPNVVASDNAGNTAMGTNALLNLTDGTYNTASGSYALYSNTTGSSNTADGLYALVANTTGSYNTAAGFYALAANTTGSLNTATGYSALRNNTTGFDNTATGFYALWSNTTGNANTATGESALYGNTTGYYNTATGFYALVGNATGFDNTAAGYFALANNSEGNANTASGSEALYYNTTGRNNVAIGKSALLDNTTGRNNIAIGWYAGRRTDGNDNILLAHKGVVGESQTMRLGIKGTAGVAGSGITRTYIAGIKGVTTGLSAASAVFVDANGQLGTIKSSARFKEDIQPMANVSERLFALRPVTFRYKQADVDGSKPVQFGLIAEEVAKAFPELVIYDEEGKPETVRYDLVATMLLNEFQKERALVAAQAAELAQLKQEFAEMAAVIARLDKTRMVATTD